MSGRYISKVGGPYWQWETGRVVSPPTGIDEVHFAAERSPTDYLVAADDDGNCEVPNVLMQHAGAVRMWACDGTQVVSAATLKVRSRAKPTDYVYTPTEVASVESVATDAVAAALAEGIAYANLQGLPTIEGVTVVGDLTFEDFELTGIGDEEIESLFE